MSCRYPKKDLGLLFEMRKAATPELEGFADFS